VKPGDASTNEGTLSWVATHRSSSSEDRRDRDGRRSRAELAAIPPACPGETHHATWIGHLKAEGGVGLNVPAWAECTSRRSAAEQELPEGLRGTLRWLCRCFAVERSPYEIAAAKLLPGRCRKQSAATADRCAGRVHLHTRTSCTAGLTLSRWAWFTPETPSDRVRACPRMPRRRRRSRGNHPPLDRVAKPPSCCFAAAARDG
jgi:hypothetical protein